jgi:hypothetical protein
MFMLSVRGPGFNATLIPPVTALDASGQYPIGDTTNWLQIVGNIAAIVDEFDRTFVAEIEGARVVRARTMIALFGSGSRRGGAQGECVDARFQSLGSRDFLPRSSRVPAISCSSSLLD